MTMFLRTDLGNNAQATGNGTALVAWTTANAHLAQ